MLQNWAANTILKRKSGVNNADILKMVVPFPTPNTRGNSLEDEITAAFFMYLIMFWLFCFTEQHTALCKRRNLKLKRCFG
jgi:hypothetical protein